MCSARRFSLWLALGLWALTGVARGDSSDTPPIFVQRAEQNYEKARARYHSQITSAEAAWQFGRACFDRAEVESDKKGREGFAEEGCYACRQALVDDPRSAW